jgi:hypothetical protein
MESYGQISSGQRSATMNLAIIHRSRWRPDSIAADSYRESKGAEDE